MSVGHLSEEGQYPEQHPPERHHRVAWQLGRPHQRMGKVVGKPGSQDRTGKGSSRGIAAECTLFLRIR